VAVDPKKIDDSAEIDDLASFGALSSPDIEDSGFAIENESAASDLTSLAASSKAERNGHLDLLSKEEDAKVDLSNATAPIVNRAVEAKPPVSGDTLRPPALQKTDEEPAQTEDAIEENRAALRQPLPSFENEPKERQIQEKKTPTSFKSEIKEGEERDEPDPRYKEPQVIEKRQTHWAFMILFGFTLGLTAAGVSIYAFIKMERSNSEQLALKSTAQIATDQHQQTTPQPIASGQQTTPQPVVAPSGTPNSNPSNPAPALSALPEPEPEARHSGTEKSHSSHHEQLRSERRAEASLIKNNPAPTPVSKPVAQPQAVQAPQQPVSNSEKSQETAKAPQPEHVAEPKVAKTTQPVKSDQSSSNGALSPAELDRLLDNAFEGKKKSGGDKSAARGEPAEEKSGTSKEIPVAPTRADVTEAMSVLLPAIRGCAHGLSGLATANVVVLNDGKVASVKISGSPFAGSPAGQCIEGVIQKARFPRFSQSSFRVQYPLSIR
jgi:hypothetical protein